MSKINISYLDFTKQYRNLSYKPVQEAYTKIDNPATKFDNFLNTSIFSKRLEKSSLNQSELQPKMRGPTKPDYFFIENCPRFKEDINCNQKIFGQKYSYKFINLLQTQFNKTLFFSIQFLQARLFQRFRIIVNLLFIFIIPTEPKERVKELQLIKKEQELYKSLRQDVNFLNRKNRILDNLHKSETQKQSKNRNLTYDKYRNQNECFEFNNLNECIGDKMNLSFHLSKDWQNKKRCETLRLDTFERVISQNPPNLKVNVERMNFLKFRENCGRDYKIINLTKDE